MGRSGQALLSYFRCERSFYRTHRGIQYLELFFLPIVVSFFIVLPHLKDPQVYPLEINDEPAHTFVEIPMALKAFAHGQIPKINLYNNFGTPLLGDPIVSPLALHAIPFLFLEPVQAQMLNKVLIAFLTLVTLTLFYRFFFNNWIAPFCSFMCFSSPSFQWFFHHFHTKGFFFTLPCF